MAKKIKLKGFEGEIDDLIKICSEGKIELAELLDIDKSTKLKPWYVILCIIFFSVSCFCTWLFRDMQNVSMFLYILDLVFFGSCVVLIQLIWEKLLVTIFALVFGVSIFLLCLGVLTPEEAAKRIEQNVINTK